MKLSTQTTQQFSEVASLYNDYANAYETRDGNTDEIRNEIKEKMRNAGYSEAESFGTHRDVWVSNESSQRHVVKFAIGDLGVSANVDEVENHRRIADTRLVNPFTEETVSGDELIADILTHEERKYRWEAQEYIEVTPNNVSPEQAQLIDNAFSASGINIDELYAENMGVGENGHPVAFDYEGT